MTNTYQKDYADKKYFGGNAKKVLERDKYKCQHCGLTQEEHIAKYGTELLIHHINGQGYNSEVKDNRLENLITLCKPCHSKLHAPKPSGNERMHNFTKVNIRHELLAKVQVKAASQNLSATKFIELTLLKELN